MMKRALPLIALGLVILCLALFMPSATGVRIAPERLTPTPDVRPEPTPTPTPVPTATPIPAPTEYVLRSETDSAVYNEDVALIQARLRELGFYAGVADGYYGRTTFTAVLEFQRMNGLKDDGKAGEETQRMLFEGDQVRDLSGRIYEPLVIPTPAPTPTPSPTPRGLSMDEFSPGPAPDPRWFGGSVYRDASIEATVENKGGVTVVRVRIVSASQFRGALAGTYEMPQNLDIETLSEMNRAVVAFAGTDYRTSDALEMRQRLKLKDVFSDEKYLLIVDTQGRLRLCPPANARETAERLGPAICQALTVEDALIVSGIVQSNPEKDAPGRLLALGQTGELSYVVISAEMSPADLAAMMKDMGCENAAVIGKGGIYTCLGDETRESYRADADVSNILYFACYTREAE